jgi:2-C-methyl-D-erythritol 4-phosphate cytidylyltransferase
MKEHCTAIVLAAGRGRRMGTKTAKQYLELQGKPVLAYALEVFEQSSVIDDILLITGEDHIDYCKKEICEKYGIKKVSAVAPGGKERYESVWKALCILKERGQSGYVMIHDGARPFLTEDILERVYRQVQTYKACVVGMPVKDTIKLIDKAGQITESPDRSFVWQAQTPQAFAIPLIIEAFEKQMKEDCSHITDDAMVVERRMGVPVYMVEGSYRNIKITTPEDLMIAQALLRA